MSSILLFNIGLYADTSQTEIALLEKEEKATLQKRNILLKKAELKVEQSKLYLEEVEIKLGKAKINNNNLTDATANVDKAKKDLEIATTELNIIKPYMKKENKANVEKKVKKEFNNINDRLLKLENFKQKNRMVVYKDIESIYDFVIGDDYTFKNAEGNVTGIVYKNFCFYDGVKYKDGNSSTDDNTNKYKLLAVEEVLNEGCNDETFLDSNTTTIKRIKNIYEKINFHDWDRDRIQFTVLTNYVTKESAPMVSIGILAYPSYKKYIPGKFDFWRRYAVYLGLGQIESLDDTKEFNSLAYSAGISVELQKGFGLNFGGVMYSAKDTSSNTAFKTEKSLTLGVTLSSELWKNLFSFN